MTRVVAYTFEADVHCVACTCSRFAPEVTGRGPGVLMQWHEDEHGVPIEAVDNEGNTLHPVFSTDEVTTTHFTHCGTCRGPL